MPSQAGCGTGHRSDEVAVRPGKTKYDDFYPTTITQLSILEGLKSGRIFHLTVTSVFPLLEVPMKKQFLRVKPLLANASSGSLLSLLLIQSSFGRLG
jgi:hypothetical protein